MKDNENEGRGSLPVPIGWIRAFRLALAWGILEAGVLLIVFGLLIQTDFLLFGLFGWAILVTVVAGIYHRSARVPLALTALILGIGTIFWTIGLIVVGILYSGFHMR